MRPGRHAGRLVGRALAQQFALYKPQRCRRLVLASTATGSLVIPAGPRILKNMITARRYRDPAYAVQIAANVYGGSCAGIRNWPDNFSTSICG
jgi:pimeloyl-ACP methyl ester carboxylesterase